MARVQYNARKTRNRCNSRNAVSVSARMVNSCVVGGCAPAWPLTALICKHNLPPGFQAMPSAHRAILYPLCADKSRWSTNWRVQPCPGAFSAPSRCSRASSASYGAPSEAMHCAMWLLIQNRRRHWLGAPANNDLIALAAAASATDPSFWERMLNSMGVAFFPCYAREEGVRAPVSTERCQHFRRDWHPCRFRTLFNHVDPPPPIALRVDRAHGGRQDFAEPGACGDIHKPRKRSHAPLALLAAAYRRAGR